MIKTITSRLITQHKNVFKFSFKQNILNHFYAADTSTPAYKILHHSIHTVPEAIKIQEVQPGLITYNVTKLPSGVTVLTEATSVPGNVRLGLFLDVGTRDQTNESSGSLQSIKNTLFKTVLNTNQTVNFGVHQMSGGEFSMHYDRESTYWKASCLAHDTVDVFSVLTDCALEPRSVVAANVAITKNEHAHKLDAFLGGNQLFNDNIYQIAYGANRGLGLPIKGLKKNVSYLNAHTLQQFQLENISADRLVISGGGIDQHQEFVDLVNDKLSTLSLPNKSKAREPAVYQGGQVRNLTEANTINVALIFQGLNTKRSVPLYLAEQILGLNKHTSRLQSNVLGKLAYVDTAEAFLASFTDSGLFGIKLSGSASHAQQVVQAGLKQLRNLTTISQQQLNVAKQALKIRMNKVLECRGSRLEDATKSLYRSGIANPNYSQLIDAVTVSQVEEAVKAALKSKLTLLVQGGQVNAIPSYDSLSNSLQ